VAIFSVVVHVNPCSVA